MTLLRFCILEVMSEFAVLRLSTGARLCSGKFRKWNEDKDFLVVAAAVEYYIVRKIMAKSCEGGARKVTASRRSLTPWVDRGVGRP